MLHVILTILKILLWIILAILGLVLLILVLVLFAPIKYRVETSYHGTALVNAKINFLIASIRVMFEQQTKKVDFCIRLAGIKLNLGKERKPKKTKKVKKDSGKEPGEFLDTPSSIDITEDYDDINTLNTADNLNVANNTNVTDNLNVADNTNVTDDLNVTDNTNDTNNLNVADSTNDVDNSNYVDDLNDIDDLNDFDLFDDDIDSDVPKEQQSLFGRIKAFFRGLKDKLVSLKGKAENFSKEQIESKLEAKINKLKKDINKLKKFWNLKCTVKTRNYLKRYLASLVKHIGPRKVKGYVRYGFGDPCKTGQVTGYLSLLPFVYSKHFSLEPDFYEKIIDAELFIKGRIRLGYILRIVLNINVWRTIIVARRIFRKKGNANNREV